MNRRPTKNGRPVLILAWVLCCLICFCLCWMKGQARAAGADSNQTLFSGVKMDWGGHLRAVGSMSYVDDDSIYQYADADPYADGQLELRLKNRIDLRNSWMLQTHYEAVMLGGDTYENDLKLQRRFPLVASVSMISAGTDRDEHRLFGLTGQLVEKDRYRIYHRLDRLNLSIPLDEGTLRLGRQVVTWGDGMIFNPMDLFNPFAPTAIQRDYKPGEDMAHVQLQVGAAEIQALCLPRRNTQTGYVRDDESSYALKYHRPVGAAETDVMVARHYGDVVAGIGGSGYLGNAVWRINATYTRVSGEDRRNHFFQMVANLDYAWMWAGKNVYGLMEFYVNEAGREDDYAKAADDVELAERLERGELFTIGRYYLAGRLQVELHPLLQFHATAIVNVKDPSGLLQPQLLWDVSGNLQMIFGAQGHWGGHSSEFGGYDVTAAGSAIKIVPADRIFLWLTYYF